MVVLNQWGGGLIAGVGSDGKITIEPNINMNGINLGAVSEPENTDLVLSYGVSLYGLVNNYLLFKLVVFL